MLLVKVSLSKIISLKKGFWLQSCKIAGYQGAWTAQYSDRPVPQNQQQT